MLPSMCRSAKWSLFSKVFPPKPCIHISCYTIHATCFACLIPCGLITQKIRTLPLQKSSSLVRSWTYKYLLSLFKISAYEVISFYCIVIPYNVWHCP
jgi:hypothetical protein